MPVYAPALTVKESDGSPTVVPVRTIQVSPGTETDNGAGDVTWDNGGAGATEILDIPTAETDDTLVLAPDGAGGVEFRAEVGGSGDGFTYLTKASDQNRTVTGVVDDADLQFAVTAGKIYMVEGYLLCSGNSTVGDFQWNFAVSAGTMDGRGWYKRPDTSLSFVPAVLTATAASATSASGVGVNAAADAGFPTVIRIWFAFRQNTTGGTFSVQFGVNSFSAGREARLMAGSYIRYKVTN